MNRLRSIAPASATSRLHIVVALTLTLGAAAAQAASPLCASSANNQNYEWVTRVQIADGVSETGPSPYYDGTAAALTSLAAGQTYEVEVDVATNGNTYTEYVKIWFDMNQDDVIQDPEELLFNENQNVTTLATFSGTITIPPTAFNGQMYLRVIMQYAALPALCGTYTYGETEDYLVNVTGATSNPANKTLTVAIAGAGNGTVTSTPSGVDCPGTCAFDFAEGASVTLTATPDGSSAFVSWSGDCGGTNPAVSVSMNADKSCTASFSASYVDECALGTDNCSNDATCSNTAGSFTCACNSGYSGDGVICSDLNECALGTNNCASDATCSNTLGAFTCACNSGYSGDGVTCSDLNECVLNTDNCASDATCSNTAGSFTCACNSGYSGDGVDCADLDECALSTDNCSNDATCSNTLGAFTCACNSGYSGDGVTCSDLDECALSTDNCSPDAACSNNAGSFTCACDAGYYGDGVGCEAACGDAIRAGSEECDDGGESAACNPDCTMADCGDGIVNTAAGEQCDDVGESVECDVDCTWVVCGDGTTNTSAGEQCDDSGESANCDADCTVVECGDQYVNVAAGEGCDDGNSLDIDDCLNTCISASCGDGIIHEGTEFCDNGLDNSDTATDACRLSCSPAVCGDAVVDTGEECDDGTDNSDVDPDACRNSCGLPTCGDGVIDFGEECDDAGANSDSGVDACRLDCTHARCGDGVVDSGEGCDLGESNSEEPGATCRLSCSAQGCGDGVVDPGEECDDAAANSGAADACRTTCVLPTCGDGVQDYAEECDNGQSNSNTVKNACRENCSAATCGDGVIDTNEGCDDGNTNDEDACLNSCVSATCGDGVIQLAVEECDDAVNNADAPGANCRSGCTLAICGDGIVDPGEECDGGIDGSDKCNVDCTLIVSGETTLVDTNGDGVYDAYRAGGGCNCKSSNSGMTLWGFVAMFVLGGALRRRRKTAKALMTLVALVAIPTIGWAQTTQVSGNIPVERFQQTVTHDGVLDLESGLLPQPGSFNVGLSMNYANDPLILSRVADGQRTGALIHHRLGAEIVGSYTVLSWLALGISAQGTLYQDRPRENEAAVVAFNNVQSFGIGDIGLRLKAQVLSAKEHFVNVAFLSQVTLPTGGSQNYMGDTGVTGRFGVAVSRTLLGARLAANLDYLTRPRSETLSLVVDDEISYRVGASYPLESLVHLPIEAAVRVSGVFSATTSFADAGQAGIEILGGARYNVWDDLYVSVGAGRGLTAAFGNPDLRILASLSYSHQGFAEPVVMDTGESAPGYLATSGIQRTRSLETDAASTQEVVQAPAEIEVSAEPTTSGFEVEAEADVEVEVADRDGDGIADHLDACPDEAGSPDHGGCAQFQSVVLKEGRIELTGTVNFASGGFEVLPSSVYLIDEFAAVLDKHPEIVLVIIEGHTDNVGSAQTNGELSTMRADEMKRLLTERGISPDRLEAVGYGPERPIASNDTEEGRSLNRRVEFLIKRR